MIRAPSVASTAAVVSNGVASRPAGGVLGSGLAGGGEGSKPHHHHHTRMRAAVQGLEEAEDSDQEDIEVVNFNDGKKKRYLNDKDPKCAEKIEV